jgi:threonyl-tRNA synthetase
MLVIGDKEEREGTVSPRQRSGEAMRELRIEDWIQRVKSEYPTL